MQGVLLSPGALYSIHPQATNLARSPCRDTHNTETPSSSHQQELPWEERCFTEKEHKHAIKRLYRLRFFKQNTEPVNLSEIQREMSLYEAKS